MSFSILCQINSTPNNILGIIAYNLQTCVEACASYNAFNNPKDNGGDIGGQGDGTRCKGFTYTNQMQFGLSNWKGNCWLKTAVDQLQSGAPEVYSTIPVLTAILCGEGQSVC
jgi:hypothetical protein